MHISIYTVSYKHSKPPTCTCFDNNVAILREVFTKDILQKFISVINQLDAQNFCFTVSLFHASTRFEHMSSSSGGQNCITCNFDLLMMRTCARNV